MEGVKFETAFKILKTSLRYYKA